MNIKILAVLLFISLVGVAIALPFSNNPTKIAALLTASTHHSRRAHCSDCEDPDASLPYQSAQDATTCGPNFAGATVNVVSSGTDMSWCFRAPSGEAPPAGAPLESESFALTPFRIEQTGQPALDYIFKLGGISSNSVILTDSAGEIRLGDIAGSGNPSFAIVCQSCSGSSPSNGVIATSCTVQDAQSLDFVSVSNGSVSLQQDASGGTEQLFDFVLNGSWLPPPVEAEQEDCSDCRETITTTVDAIPQATTTSSAAECSDCQDTITTIVDAGTEAEETSSSSQEECIDCQDTITTIVEYSGTEGTDTSPIETINEETAMVITDRSQGTASVVIEVQTVYSVVETTSTVPADEPEMITISA